MDSSYDKATVTELVLLHSCLEKGVSLQIYLDRPLDMTALSQQPDMDVRVVQTAVGGFYRINLRGGIVTLTGIVTEPKVTAVFLFYHREKALTMLSEMFKDFRDQYMALAN